MAAVFVCKFSLILGGIFLEQICKEVTAYVYSFLVALPGVFPQISHNTECVYNGLLGHDGMNTVSMFWP